MSILWNFCKGNTDGTGSVHLKDGKFIEHKWPKSLYWTLRNTNFLSHMPHDGWTLVHLRAASHGGNFRRNTHPFIVGDRAVIHNGVWLEYEMAALLLAKQGIRPRGETDTEVGAHVLNIIGPRKFAESVTGGGVFMSLNRDGSLEISKTSGDLMVTKDEAGKVLIASELAYSKYIQACDTVEGYMKFGSDGRYIKHVEKDVSWVNTVSAADESDDDDDDEDEDDLEGVYTGKTVRNFSKLLLKYFPPTAKVLTSREEEIAAAYNPATNSLANGWFPRQAAPPPRAPAMAGIRCGGMSHGIFDCEGSWD